jgi:hypothetical protein
MEGDLGGLRIGEAGRIVMPSYHEIVANVEDHLDNFHFTARPNVSLVDHTHPLKHEESEVTT